MLVFHSDLSLTFEQVHDYFRMQKLEEHNSFVLKTNTSRIAQHANQSGHDIDFNSAIIERKGRVYRKELFLKAWYSNRDRKRDIYARPLATNRL